MSGNDISYKLELSPLFMHVQNAYFDEAHENLCYFALKSMSSSMSATSHAYHPLLCQCTGFSSFHGRVEAKPGVFSVRVVHMGKEDPEAFLGNIFVKCSRCGFEHRAVSSQIEGPEKEITKQVELVCKCGGKELNIAYCQLAERGFSGDSIIVAECKSCKTGMVLARPL